MQTGGDDKNCPGMWDSLLKLQTLIYGSKLKMTTMLLDLTTTCLMACMVGCLIYTVYACVFIARHCNENTK